MSLPMSSHKMDISSHHFTHDDYTIGWICALPIESAAAIAMLDERHDSLSQVKSDHNSYTLGRIGCHNVVIACLPDGIMGTISAATVASQMQSTFHSLRFGLMVGIGGGVPSEENDIRLGDVVVSKPIGSSSGIIQYDFGKTVQNGNFTQTGFMAQPPAVLLTAISKLHAIHMLDGTSFSQHIDALPQRYPNLAGRVTYPGQQQDHLFNFEYDHPPDQKTCSFCDKSRLVQRPLRKSDAPQVHYGLIASGNQVMRDGNTRERLQKQLKVLCFEMEAAGLMNNYPCLVIRGICDYSDSHKNKEWQPYAAFTAAAYAKELLGVIPESQVIKAIPVAYVTGLSKNSQLDDSNLSRPIIELPFSKDDNFVGREDILAQMKDQLRKDHKVALHGIGGIGKSQIAIEYAYRHHEEFPSAHIFWMYCSNKDRFTESCQSIARNLKLPGFDDPKIDSKDLVSIWLNDHAHDRKWLLILDNADDEKFLCLGEEPRQDVSTELQEMNKPVMDYLPKRIDSGKEIVITTRNRHVAQYIMDWKPCIEVSPFSLDEAKELLEVRAGSLATEAKLSSIERLLDILGYIPLAISQAIAFMQLNQVSLDEYLAALEKDDQNLTDYLSEDLIDHRRDRKTSNGVFRTWKLTFDLIRRQHPRTAQLLSLMAMFDRQQIQEELLRRPDEKDVDFDNAVGALLGFSLIARGTQLHNFTIHRLVQLSIQEWLSHHGETQYYSGEALRQLARVFPSGFEYENKSICESLIPHVQAVLRRATASKDEVFRSKLLCEASWYQYRIGNLASAYQLAEESESLQSNLDKNNTRYTWDSTILLGCLINEKGEFERSEQVCRRALGIIDKKLGSEHLETLACLNNLGVALGGQGKHFEAEKIYRRVFEASERILGPEHLETLRSLNNLGVALGGQGKHDEEEKIYRRVAEARERLLGPEHLETLRSLNNLGVALGGQGKYDEEEKIDRRVAEASERLLGPEHPDTLTSFNNLGATLGSQGKHDDEEKIYRRVVEARERILGPEHPDTLASLYNLGYVLDEQGDKQGAEKMYRQAYEGRINVLGAHHPFTLDSYRALVNILLEAGKQEEAKAIEAGFERFKKQVVGKSDESTVKGSRGQLTVKQLDEDSEVYSTELRPRHRLRTRIFMGISNHTKMFRRKGKKI